MIIKGSFSPPKNWQSPVGFYVTIEDVGCYTEKACIYCKQKTDTLLLLPPDLAIEIFSNNSLFEEDPIKERISKTIEKWYIDKIICQKDDCWRKYTNDLYAEVSKKRWEITSTTHKLRRL